MSESSAGVVRRYLEDAVAAEHSFEAQLGSFAAEAQGQKVHDIFGECALVSKHHGERLLARLEALGGSPSLSKGFLSRLFALAPKQAHTVTADGERTAQNLMTAYAIANSQLALYEVVTAMAEAAGDPESAALARSLQSEEKHLAESVWSLLSALSPEAMSARNLP